MLQITAQIAIPLKEIELSAVRSQGAGGQNVNKVATAVMLRFDINASGLPEECKARLLALPDRRVTREGLIVIKAQQHRTQEQNRVAALERLRSLIRSVTAPIRKRIATRPGRVARRKRLELKTRRGRLKVLRGKVTME